MIGHIPIKKNDYKVKISMHDPKAFLKSSIIELLVNSEIAISNKYNSEINNLDTLMIYESPNVRELVRCVNFKSNNNYAEHLLMKSVFLKDSSLMLNKAPIIMQDFWESEINISNQVLFADGCGLSRKNLTSSHAINQLLLYQLKNKSLIIKDDFLNSLPEAGISGTLKYIGKGTLLEGNFIGKSGSMRSVRSYSGYFKKYNQYYPFTIMVNNFVCKDAEVRKLIENLMISFYKKI
jgi:D-alanyl-D-alanine carboxypeptidase/D-alanyl-D-alanine-endopeptidase (penicillin-binding protein 4)